MPWSTTLADALDDLRVHIASAPDRGLLRDGLPTGLDDLDRALGGLQPGRVTILAGAPAVGLTSFAVSVARNVIRQGRRSVVWASVDEDLPEVTRNFLSSQALVSTEKLRLGTLSQSERERCDTAIRELTRSSRPGQPRLHGFEADCNPLDIVAGRDMTIADIVAAVTALPEADLLVIDDLKRLMYNELEARPSWQGRDVDGLLMAELGRIAASHDLHVLATVRLFRIWHRSGEPASSDFRPYRELHNMADNVLGVWRGDLDNEDSHDRGIMRMALLRSGVGQFRGRVGHLLDRRLVVNLARDFVDGVPP